MDDHASPGAIRELPIINVFSDTRDQLAHARRQALRGKYSDVFICDIDAHHLEHTSWNEIVQYIEDPVLKEHALLYHSERGPISAPFGLNSTFGMRYQSAGGRIPHQMAQREKTPGAGGDRDVTLAQRSMDGMGIDYQIIFPTAMLTLGRDRSRQRGSVRSKGRDKLARSFN